MKILIVNTFDRAGGAARSARRLHFGLRGIGVDSEMLVLHKDGDDAHTHVASAAIQRHFKERLPLVDALPLGFYPSRNVTHWSNTFLPGSIEKQIQELNPDVVHLHWINRGLLSVADLKRWNKPVVWTLHDHWPFTGGCHYPSDECEAYKNSCGTCPALGSKRAHDLSRFNWSRKNKQWQGVNLNIVGPSAWLTQRAADSSLFGKYPCHNLPNGIDTDLYQPGDKEAARKALGLPVDKILILVVAMNPDTDRNKGGHLALEAIQLAADKLGPDAAEILIAGSPEKGIRTDGPWRIHSLGVLKEEAEMAQLYRAADVQLVPSYYENLSNALMEACSSGLPCVAFNAGGNGDLVYHQAHGFLADAYKASSLAEGLVQYIEHPLIREAHGAAAREHILQFSELNLIAHKHQALYQQILS
ncbi:glycosyltransferase [Kiritimatiellota bacterium B12222]|nr:glycosyltransferase [Kiritimatiellota bacterium B12222]